MPGLARRRDVCQVLGQRVVVVVCLPRPEDLGGHLAADDGRSRGVPVLTRRCHKEARDVGPRSGSSRVARVRRTGDGRMSPWGVFDSSGATAALL